MTGSYHARVTALENEATDAGRFLVVLAGEAAPHRRDVDDSDVIILLPLPPRGPEEVPVELDPDAATVTGDGPAHRRRRIL